VSYYCPNCQQQTQGKQCWTLASAAHLAWPPAAFFVWAALTHPLAPLAPLLAMSIGVGGPVGAVIALSFRKPACAHCGCRHIVRAETS